MCPLATTVVRKQGGDATLVTEDKMQDDTLVYAGSGPYMDILFTHPSKRWFNRERWSVQQCINPDAFSRMGRFFRSLRSRPMAAADKRFLSVIAHKCPWYNATPWFEGLKLAYNILPETEAPEYCWRCHKPMPVGVVGLWKLHNMEVLNAG